MIHVYQIKQEKFINSFIHCIFENWFMYILKNKDMSLWKFIEKELSGNLNVILIVVIDRLGSSPGKVGFKMAISESGAMIGSIGGGIMEYNMVELAKKEAKSTRKKIFLKRQVHNPDSEKDKSGMICSGEQTHAFVLFDKFKIDIVKKIIHQLDKGECGTLKINQSEIIFNDYSNIDNQNNFRFTDENNWEYTEHIGLKDTIYIFGAGHVSLPLSEIFRILDFRVIVYDDRSDLSTFNSNSFAHQKHIIDYKRIGNLIPEGPNSYVVIMTVAHKSDALVLKQLVSKNLRYLGMIGSKNKTKTIFENLITEGVSNSELEKVDAPIGLSINSQTPAEIAISIAAKVIQVKNS